MEVHSRAGADVRQTALDIEPPKKILALDPAPTPA